MKKLYILIFVMVFSISVSGQTAPSKADTIPDLSEAEKKILNDLFKARASLAYCGYVGENEDCKKNDYETMYRDSLAKAVNYPKLVNILISEAAKTYEGFRLTQKSAPQASQVADEHNAQMLRIIAAQNQKIIELLEKLVNKK